MKKYDQEAVTAMYAVLSYMQENDLPTNQIEVAIEFAEKKLTEQRVAA
tara:strand:- start:313 stop:456 length:144 start_codon:yes stop_codon:yes gene_type:complete